MNIDEALIRLNIGENIQKALKRRGIRPAKLAEALHISRASVSQWLHNKAVPTATNLIQMSEFLHASLDELLLGKVERPIYEYDGQSFSLSTKLNFDKIECGAYKRFVVRELGEEAPTVQEVLLLAYGPKYRDKTPTIVCENLLEGIVLRVGNHKTDEVEIVGRTQGYA